MLVFVSPFTLLIVSIIAYLLATRNLSSEERRFAALGLVAHAVATVAHVLYYVQVQGYGDMIGYFGHGQNIGRLLWDDFGGTIGEVLRLIVHAETTLPVTVGGSTGTTAAFAGLCYFVVGDSLYAMSFLVSIFAFLGQMGIYRALRDSLPAADRLLSLGAILFVPSVIFWTSGIQKEAFLIGFLGLFLWSTATALRRLSVVALVTAPVCLVGISLIKPYVLLPLVAAFAGWFFAARRRRFGVAAKVLIALAAFMSIVVVARVFPEYDDAHLLYEMQMRRDASLTSEGGSNIEFGAQGERTTLGELRYIPMALVNMLARPTLIDVKNAAMLLAALELSVLFVLFFRIGLSARPSAVIAEIRRNPLLLSAALFVLTFGVGVGLATTNLGTLSRYRTPMMPFYVLFAMLLHRRFLKKSSSRTRTSSSLAVLARARKRQTNSER